MFLRAEFSIRATMGPPYLALNRLAFRGGPWGMYDDTAGADELASAVATEIADA